MESPVPHDVQDILNEVNAGTAQAAQLLEERLQHVLSGYRQLQTLNVHSPFGVFDEVASAHTDASVKRDLGLQPFDYGSLQSNLGELHAERLRLLAKTEHLKRTTISVSEEKISRIKKRELQKQKLLDMQRQQRVQAQKQRTADVGSGFAKETSVQRQLAVLQRDPRRLDMLPRRRPREGPREAPVQPHSNAEVHYRLESAVAAINELKKEKKKSEKRFLKKLEKLKRMKKSEEETVVVKENPMMQSQLDAAVGAIEKLTKAKEESEQQFLRHLERLRKEKTEAEALAQKTIQEQEQRRDAATAELQSRLNSAVEAIEKLSKAKEDTEMQFQQHLEQLKIAIEAEEKKKGILFLLSRRHQNSISPEMQSQLDAAVGAIEKLTKAKEESEQQFLRHLEQLRKEKTEAEALVQRTIQEQEQRRDAATAELQSRLNSAVEAIEKLSKAREDTETQFQQHLEQLKKEKMEALSISHQVVQDREKERESSNAEMQIRLDAAVTSIERMKQAKQQSEQRFQRELDRWMTEKNALNERLEKLSQETHERALQTYSMLQPMQSTVAPMTPGGFNTSLSVSVCSSLSPSDLSGITDVTEASCFSLSEGEVYPMPSTISEGEMLPAESRVCILPKPAGLGRRTRDAAVESSIEEGELRFFS